MFKKFASFAVLSKVLIPQNATQAQLARVAHRVQFDYQPRPGFLYVRSRAISSRCNDNFDEFPAEEIKKSFASFIGKPVFVNHHNDNHRRSRGVIIDAALHEDLNPDGTPDTWAEVLMEVDAIRFPKLAKAILAGHIDRTSMGTDVAYSICSACNNKASSPSEYCQHIPRMKGQRIYRATASGKKEGVLIREKCYGLGFFENSLLVEEPADPTAYFTGVDDRGMKMTAKANPAVPKPGGKGARLNEATLAKDASGARAASLAEVRRESMSERPRGAEILSPDALPDTIGDRYFQTTNKTGSGMFEETPDWAVGLADRMRAAGDHTDTRCKDCRHATERHYNVGGDTMVCGKCSCSQPMGGGSKVAMRRQAHLTEQPSGHEYWAEPSGLSDYNPTLVHHGLGDHQPGQGPWYVTRHPVSRHYQVVDKDNLLVGGGHATTGHPSYELHDPAASQQAVHSAIQANQDHGHLADWSDREGTPAPDKRGLSSDHYGSGYTLDGVPAERVASHLPPPPFEHSTEDPKMAEYAARAKASPAPQVHPTRQVQESSSREHGTTYRTVRHGEPGFDHPSAFPASSPDEQWHGPYRVIKHPDTGRYHVVDNQDRATRYGGRDGMEDQPTAEYVRDFADHRQQSKEKAKGIAENLYGGIMNILDPGGTDESRATERHTNRLNDLMHRYQGGESHPLTPGRFGFDDDQHEGDENGEPYYEVTDPGGSGWKARDYGGPNLHIYHAATGEEAHDLVDAGDPETAHTHQQQKPVDYGHEEMHGDLQHWIHGKPDDEEGYAPGKDYARNDPRVSRWQRRQRYTGSRSSAMNRTAYGETKAPSDVDTLRDEECPVCGEQDSYDGNSCQVCGFDAPPEIFRDPDLDKAKNLDLRKDVNDQAGALPGQDANGGMPTQIPGESIPGTSQIPDEMTDPGTPTDDQVLSPDQLGPDGQPLVPGVDPNAANQHFNQGGEPFTPGPNAPTEPGEPEQVLDPDQLDQDGQPIEQDPQSQQNPVVNPAQGDPGTPDDGVADLVCPACGFSSDAAQPTSVDMDTQAVSPSTGDGTLAGDVCPNCGQAQLLSVGQMEQMAGGPVMQQQTAARTAELSPEQFASPVLPRMRDYLDHPYAYPDVAEQMHGSAAARDDYAALEAAQQRHHRDSLDAFEAGDHPRSEYHWDAGVRAGRAAQEARVSVHFPRDEHPLFGRGGPLEGVPPQQWDQQAGLR